MNPLKLRPQLLTDDAFAPYGKVISGSTRSGPDFVNEGGTTGWRVDLQIAKPLYMIMRTPPGTLTVARLERHINVSQTFLPLGGGRAALVVSRPTLHDPLPRPKETAAFLLDGSVGYAIHVGTWHSLDRLPLAATSTTWLMITDSDTQADLVHVARGTAVHTEVVHLPEAWGFPIEIDI